MSETGDLAAERHGMPPAPKWGSGVTTEEWLASWFFEHDGHLWCRVCGCQVLDGWQLDHYKTVHATPMGF